MFKKILLSTFAILAIGVIGFTTRTTVSAKDKDPRADYPNCSSRIPVAIDRFKTENIYVGWWNNDVALNSREVAVDELVNSGCFSVLEREEGSGAPVGVMNEKALARSDEARPGAKAAHKRQMKIAENLVSYALTGVSHNNEGLNVGGLGGAGGGFGGLGGGFKKSDVNLTCKVINTSTSEILASARVKAGGTSFDVGSVGGGFGAGGFGVGGVNYFKQSKVGKMMSDAIHKCSVEMAKAVSR
jgi:curli biogenesis system outer membrane secretion channel CsgG